MATARICDRCGGVYGKNTVEVNFGDNKYGVVRGVCVMFAETDKSAPPCVEPRRNAYMDLCDSCTNKLALFLKDKDATIESGTKDTYRGSYR